MKLTHLDPEGRARMVDVGDKPETDRRAVASGTITMGAGAFATLRDQGGPKGDVLGTAELAGVMAAKRTSDLIPLCHALRLDRVEVRATLDAGLPGVRVEATVRSAGRTGVEMEALTAVTVALLTVYDMVKATGHDLRIGDIELLEKSGGRSGDWRRSP
jgi:cyclic pyranopterin monophosphate synthase